jgi:hypothetical protein
MRRREFITLLSGTCAVWPLAARAQQATTPVVGFLGSDSPELYADRLRAFRRGLKDAGYIESENLEIEYRWANGDNNRLAALVPNWLVCGLMFWFRERHLRRSRSKPPPLQFRSSSL